MKTRKPIDVERLAAEMSGSHNLDISIAALASEINGLDRATKSVRVQMGHKILALRELLREKYGEVQRGKYDAAGLRAPVGWGKWVVENLNMTASHAGIYVNFAVDPEGTRVRENRKTNYHRLHMHTYALGCCRRAWPHLSVEERGKLVDGVLALKELI